MNQPTCSATGPQMPDRIRTFAGNLVCFFRRNKKTYYVLRWDVPSRKWLRSSSPLPDLTLHRSTVTRDGEVSINVATYAAGPSKLIPVTADGFYLKSGDNCIPILKAAHSLGQAFMLQEYTSLDTPFTQTDVALWQTAPPPLVIPPPANTLAPPAPRNRPERIPKRIAWLIAEEASKSGETCPISMSDISPITSSVTSCFHVFETEAINGWVQLHPNNTPCPVCRKPFQLTEAFSEPLPV
jgi:hypothetical protein